ncbi:MAG: hypothetical protein IPJ41_16105 [Phycisphaerales bacterium]|nr:hypothetical protein [Phycisphaerales bacterium]
MARTPLSSARTSRAGVAAAALALLLVPMNTLFAQEEASAPPPVGRISVGTERSPLETRVLRLIGASASWVEGSVAGASADSPWRRWVERMAKDAPPTGTWDLILDEKDVLGVREPGEVPADAALELSIDLNAFRGQSPQPFSRSMRGRALDALSLDNARRARLSFLPASPEDDGPLAAVLFYESRSEQPGRWHAQPIAEVAEAPYRGEAPPESPLQIDFGEQWGAFALSMTDLALTGLEGRVWAWVGVEGPVLAAPLARGASDRTVAGQMQSVFGLRLAWAREPSGRATGRLALIEAARLPQQEDPQVLVRFIRIADRTILVVATGEADLDGAATVLAKLSH